MKIALIGFPGSGKSTCFKAIVQKKNFKHHDPTKPHLECVKIPDDRLDRLSSIVKPKKKTSAELILEDLPGFHIPQIKDVTALIEVVGAFSGRDSAKDIENMDTEFLVSGMKSEVVNFKIIPFTSALEAAKEFLTNDERPTCIEWFDL